ncbi:MAG: transcription termination factor Rho [Lachnospira sp.]|nr:transcription termination factor Rho [Lachnospira sp.]
MNYEEMSLAELKSVAKERKLTGVSALKKADLIVRLMETEPVTDDSAGRVRTERRARVVGETRTVKSGSRSKAMEGTGTAKPEGRSRTAKETRSVRTERYSRDTEETRGSRTEVRNRDIGEVRSTREEPRERGTEEERPYSARTGAARSTRPVGGRSDGMIPNFEELDSGKIANGILEVMGDGFGFIRCDNYLPGENDVYVSPATIRRLNLRTGDMIKGKIKIQMPTEKFSALLRVTEVNGYTPEEAMKRTKFEDMTPIFPDERIHLENEYSRTLPMRIMDLLSPVGKGQRGMIVSPPKAGKTTLLKQIAKSVSRNYRDMFLIVLLIDERPEEVTDIRESIEGPNVEVIYSTFDELPEHHKRVSEMVLERAKRIVEHGKDVMILLDSMTRLARAYNLTVPSSGRTLSGGLDPAALHMPKKFFGAARNMRDGGSLTILATALVETGSKMDDVVFEEFKGTGNMEMVLDRTLSERRIFPAIDINRSGTRRDDLLLNEEEQKANALMHREMNLSKTEDVVEEILKLFSRTKNNEEFIHLITQSLSHRRK